MNFNIIKYLYIYFLFYYIYFFLIPLKKKKRNVYVNKLIGNGDSGLFYSPHTSRSITFNADNVVLNELHQNGNIESTIIHINDANKAILKKY